MTVKRVTKAVFPVGGLGTRFLPVTKSIPKEMLPVASKPLIQYVFEEAKMAGIEQFIFIIGRNKTVLNNHFDHSYELQDMLSEKEKEYELEQVTKWLPSAGNIAFIRQQNPLGLGHAVWCARNFIGADEHFAVLLADEMLQEEGGFLKKMIDLHHENDANVIAVNPVERHEVSSYGIVAVEDEQQISSRILSMVEKPKPEVAPSQLSITGRYILSSRIFPILENTKKGSNDEIQLTDAMVSLLKEQDFYALRAECRRFDCGNPLGFLEANIAYCLDNPNMRAAAVAMLKKYTG